MHGCCAVDASDGEGVIVGFTVSAFEAGRGFGVGELVEFVCRETGCSLGNSGSHRFDDTQQAGRFRSAFLPSRILTLRFAWRM
jgi:hypothetical protein